MTESSLYSITDGFIDRFIYATTQNVSLHGVEKDIKKIVDTIQFIKAVLVDAEEKQVHDVAIRRWLNQLEDVVYDAHELVDDVIAQNIMQLNTTTTKLVQVLTFFSISTSNRVFSNRKVSLKIKAIAERLATIMDIGKSFNLEIHEYSPVVTRVTYSDLPREVIVGRDKDKQAILDFLSINTHVKEDVSAMAIVGTGGLGKTALAQLVFNDALVKQHFNPTIWIHVSKDFDTRSLAQKIIESSTRKSAKNLHYEGQLPPDLQKEINGKRLLLVLDDVWVEDKDLWLNFKNNILSNIGAGSRILLTTRSKIVAEITSTTPPYILGHLDDENSWALFRMYAFPYEPEPNNHYIVKIAMDIVTRCGGNPLTIRAVAGSTLNFKESETVWLSFLRKGLSQVLLHQENILPQLKISYDNLPPRLKHCFAYCGIFPTQYEIDVETLINLWIAQGFIYPSGGRSMEDEAYLYFRDLLRRSFFEVAETDEDGNVTKCKIPSLMRDVAVLVAGTRLAILKEYDDNNIDKTTQHISFHLHLDSSWEIPTSLVQSKRIRSIILPNQSNWEAERGLSRSICDKLISSCKLLRVLDLHNSGIEVVPNSIGRLKHLKFLDISENVAIKSLPNSITMLPYLMVLKLSSCFGLQALPRNIKQLVNLKHLEIDWCYSLTHMPSGLGELTQLQTLSEFVLNKGINSSSLNELRSLNNLRGELKVKNLGKGIHCQAAILEEKEHLRSLTLAWDFDVNAETAERQLECLKPHTNLKELALVSYMGIRFSDWLSSLTNLVKFSLRKCRCQYLPSLDELLFLRVLVLDEMTELKYISSKPKNEPTEVLPRLEELRLTELPNLLGWWGDVDNEDGSSSILRTTTSLPSFPCLSKLIIEDCPELRSMPLYSNLEEWLVLDSTSLKHFQQTMNDERSTTSMTTEVFTSASTSSSVPDYSSPLSRLQTLCVIGIKDICYGDEIMWQRLKSLRFLRFDYLPKLKKLPEGLRHVKTLRELHIWRCNLESLPEWIEELTSLKTLGLSVCPYLKSLPDELKRLSSLETLEIVDCPILLQRCHRETGADWHKIEHIKYRLIQQPQSSISSSNYGKNLSGLKTKLRT